MPQSEPSDWSMLVDEALQSRLLETARAAYESGCSLLSDAKALLETERHCRAGALAILAEEEYSKAFILCNCAQMRRWDSVIFRSLTDHGGKQTVSQVMIDYWAWLQNNLKAVAEMNRFSFIPAQPSVLPSQTEFDAMVEKAKKQHMTKRQRDKLKQQMLYVHIDRNGSAIHKPNAVTAGTAQQCIDDTYLFKTITEYALAHVSPSFAAIAV